MTDIMFSVFSYIFSHAFFEQPKACLHPKGITEAVQILKR